VIDYLTVEQDGFGGAINADGSQVLVGVTGALIRWNIDSGEAARVYPLQTDYEVPIMPQLVEWSPDGLTAFVSPVNGSDPALLIDLETGDVLHQFQYNYPTRLIAGFTSAAFSADGQQIITGYNYFGAVVWDVVTGTATMELSTGSSGSVGGVAISPDGHYYAVANGGNIDIWALSTSDYSAVHLMALPEPEEVDLTGLTFRPDNQTLLAAYQSSDISQLFLPALVLWRVANDGELPPSLAPAAFSVGSVGVVYSVYSPNGCCGLYFSEANQLQEIDLNTGEILHTLENTPFSSVYYSGDGRQVLVDRGGSSTRVLWDLETDTSVAVLEGFPIQDVATSPDGHYFAVEGQDGAIVLLTKDGDISRHLDVPGGTPVYGMMFTADSRYLLATTTYFTDDLIRWDVATGAKETQMPNYSVLDAASINVRGINAQIYLMPDGEDMLIIPDGSDMLRVDSVTGAIETLYADSNRDIFQVVTNEQVVAASLCVEQVRYACTQYGLRVWNAVTGALLFEIPTYGFVDNLQLGTAAILAQQGDRLHRYRLESPSQLIERLGQEGRIHPFTSDECRRFALTCDPVGAG
jgi:WD40 repeat protein